MRFNPRAITVSALPARTGIVELMLLYPKLRAGPPLGRKLHSGPSRTLRVLPGRTLTARLQ